MRGNFVIESEHTLRHLRQAKKLDFSGFVNNISPYYVGS